MQRKNKNKNTRLLQFLRVLKEIEKLEDNSELKASQLVSFLCSSLSLTKRMAHHYIDVLTELGILERTKWGKYKISKKFADLE
jgi:DNA-binding IclR family transcriptional regulator